MGVPHKAKRIALRAAAPMALRPERFRAKHWMKVRWGVCPTLCVMEYFFR